MNREQIVEQAETVLAINSTLDANQVAQVLGTALVLHIARCSPSSQYFLAKWRAVFDDTDNMAHEVYMKNWNIMQ